jgi:large subunit ribosomal protein L21
MYAVIQTGGKQYKVKKGDTVQVELLSLDMGKTTDFNEVLLVGSGAAVQIGQPFVASASVSAEVVAIEKGPKVIVYHKKRRKQSDKKAGHRQPYTRLLITGISNGSGEKDLLSDEEKKKVLSNTGFAKADAWAVDESIPEASEEAPKQAKKKAAPKKAAPAKRAPAKKAAPKKKAGTAKKKTSKKS